MNTDLTGLVRIQVQYKDLSARLVYLIFYIALVIYTVMFTWTYVKRAITMAFLTLMAPLIAITYPIDKIGDGQAQAFSIWLREFIFNALLQPFHLIIYSIFMGAASEIAIKNPIYAILFLAFIIPAEKLLRKMFGFDKSNTAGAMSAAAGMFGGAAAFKAVSNLVSRGSHAGKDGKNGGSGSIRTKKPIETKTPSAFETFGGNNALLAGGSSSPDDPNSPMSSTGLNQGAINRALEERNNEENSRNSSTTRNDIVEDTRTGAGPGFLTKSGIWLPNSARNTQDGPVSQTTQQRMSRLQGAQQNLPNSDQNPQITPPVYQSPQSNRAQDNWAWTDNDTRGMGAYIRDGIGGSIRDSKSYQNLTNSKLYRNIKDGQESIRDFAETKRQNAIDFAKRIPKPLRNTARGTLAVAGRLGKAGVRAAGVATMAGIGATIGLGTGIAGDDLEDVLKYGVAGTTLGAAGLPALGSGIARTVSNTASSYAETYRTGAYGPDEAALMQQTREWIHSDENRTDMIQTYMDMHDGKRPSSSELKTLMNTGAEFYNSGITENKDIKKGIKLEREVKQRLASQGMQEGDANKLARMQAIYVAKEASKYSKADLRDDKKVAGLRKDISKQLTNSGMEASQANKQSENMVNMIKKFRGVATD